MILGLGIDLCAIDRIDALLAKENFLLRFFSEEERDYIHSKGRSGPQSAAAVFAAKEAALKALGTGIGPLSLQDIFVLHKESGQPYYGFSEKAQRHMEAMGAVAMHLSISHEGNTAAAVAVLEGAV